MINLLSSLSFDYGDAYLFVAEFVLSVALCIIILILSMPVVMLLLRDNHIFLEFFVHIISPKFPSFFKKYGGRVASRASSFLVRPPIFSENCGGRVYSLRLASFMTRPPPFAMLIAVAGIRTRVATLARSHHNH